MRKHRLPYTPLLASLAEPPATAYCTTAHLRRVFAHHPDAVAVFLPLGTTGNEVPLREAARLCWESEALQLAALREEGPFFSSSELGTVAAADDPYLPDILQRIRQL